MSSIAAIDDVENLLAHLIFADADLQSRKEFSCEGDKRGLDHRAVDAGSILHLEPMEPKHSYTMERRADRLYASCPDLLLQSPQDLLGRSSEIAIICQDRVKWSGFRAIKKPPKRIWIAQRGASIYEFHYREIFASGFSTYFVRVGAIDKAGRPVNTCIVGSHGAGGIGEGLQLVMAASVIEDAHRPGTLLSKVTDVKSISFPVPVGEHKDLFALRDAPLTAAGRRKAIVHWVAKHTRLRTNFPIDVTGHWRGTRKLSIEGMTVELSPNPNQLA